MSFWRLFYHLVWATKNRERLIQPVVEQRLYAYLVRKAGELDVFVYAINGWYDHVHLIVSIPPTLAVADVVIQLKDASSHEMSLPTSLDYPFAWQRGYGVLSLGERQRPDAEAYVRDQKRHHEQQTTNAWLERTAEVDEGPVMAETSRDARGSIVREATSGYTPSDDLPF